MRSYNIYPCICVQDVFQLTIAAFDHLSPTEGYCYNKAKSVLDVVSRIRSCVILLDLECHEFIVDMFQHFFKHIGYNIFFFFFFFFSIMLFDITLIYISELLVYCFEKILFCNHTNCSCILKGKKNTI